MISDEICEYLNKLRLSNTGCDVIFKIGSRSFLAHRVVLMARLEHFQEMFPLGIKEKRDFAIFLDPRIIDSAYFDEFLNYVYTLKIVLRDENLRAIYKTGDYFKFAELTDKAKKYMRKTLKLESIVLYKNIAEEFGLKSLESEYVQFVIQHIFSDINKSSRAKLISKLSFEELEKMNQKFRDVGRLEDVFYYSVDWVLHHKIHRSKMFLELLKKIPLQKLSIHFLKEAVSQNELVREELECANLLLDTIITMSNCHENDTTRQRVESLYAIGGKDGAPMSLVSRYDSLTHKWTPVIENFNKIVDFGCAVIGHKIYVCGGYDGRAIDKLTMFDTLTQTWKSLTPMKHARQKFGAAALNEQIYVAGGQNGTGRLALVERYCVQTDRWEDIAPLPTERSGLELVALNGYLYAIGGHDGSSALKIVERYDPETDQWTRMNDTNHKYHLFGSAVLNGNIYILEMEGCEMYSQADDKWTQMQAPSKTVAGRKLAALDGELYAIGGVVGKLEGWRGSKTFEAFDSEYGYWRTETDMDVGRCFHGVVVVKH